MSLNNPSWHSKRVLITGGAGFIGSNLAIELIQLGAKVTVIDNFSPTAGGNLFNLSSISSLIDLKKGSIGDETLATSAVLGQDYIFNLAGLLNHQDSMSAPLTDLKENVESQLRFLETVRRVNPSAPVIFTSTRQIYGHPQYLPVDEKHPIRPIDINGIHKFAAEQYHSLYAAAYGLKTVSLRLTNTYGPRQYIRSASQGVVGWFVNRALTGNPIQLFDGGDSKRDFTYVQDVVQALLLAATTPKCYGGVFNLSGHQSSLLEMAEIITDQHKSARIEVVPFPEERKRIALSHYFGCSELFHQTTGWKPTTGLSLGLKAMLDYCENHRLEYIQETLT